MADPSWPSRESRRLIGTRVSRVDGAAKVTGAAKYTFDVSRPNMLYAKVMRCPHARARIMQLDVKPAQAMPGVLAVRVIQPVGSTTQWFLDEVAVVAATSEAVAEDAVRAIVFTYRVEDHFVTPRDFQRAAGVEVGPVELTGDPEAAFARSEAVVEGAYGLPSVAHSALESHGNVCEWTDGNKLTAWSSTQAVSALAFQFADALGIPAGNVKVLAPYVGGGFGSKFSPDRWGIECAKLARDARRPVKLMLERDAEQSVAGDRPSCWASVKVGASKEGEILAWSSSSWGSGGPGGTESPPFPYLFDIPNRRHTHSSVPTTMASSRQWRAPNHPQACFITLAALDDLAAKLEMDPLTFLVKNMSLLGQRAPTYVQQLRIAADLMGWKKRWHRRGDGTGIVRRGLGVSLHAWGGRGHRSNCQVLVQPDGHVEARLASQDIGTGTRTVIAVVLAETFGLPVDAVSVTLGDSSLPPSGASGGSSTVGGVSASTRRAALAALAELFEHVAPALGVPPDALEAKDGRVQVKAEPSKGLTWAQAAGRLGMTPIAASGANPGRGKLTDGGVGGVQMADVSVDTETGVVRVEKMVAVQDCGLIVDMKTAESQVMGGLIMGISYALMEEKIMDPVSGRMLNPDLEFYKIPGLADIGELVVHLMTGQEHDSRGVIGVGEPPVISPGAAISNAVANAIGVRVPELPVSPDRVLDALERKERG